MKSSNNYFFPILKNPEDKIHNSFGLCSAWVFLSRLTSTEMI